MIYNEEYSRCVEDRDGNEYYIDIIADVYAVPDDVYKALNCKRKCQWLLHDEVIDDSALSDGYEVKTEYMALENGRKYGWGQLFPPESEAVDSKVKASGKWSASILGRRFGFTADWKTCALFLEVMLL